MRLGSCGFIFEVSILFNYKLGISPDFPDFLLIPHVSWPASLPSEGCAIRKQKENDSWQAAGRDSALVSTLDVWVQPFRRTILQLRLLEIEAVLCLYAKYHPEDWRGIERVLRFRKRCVCTISFTLLLPPF